MKADVNTQGTLSLEENLKKSLAEFLILLLFSEREHYIGELTEELLARSDGALSILFPYTAIYRLLERGYINEVKKRIAPDGRRRQYYQITEDGIAYLKVLESIYDRMTNGIHTVRNARREKNNG